MVPLSKAKLALTLLGSAAFVAVCVWLWANVDQGRHRYPQLVEIIAIAGIAFFGFCGLYALVKLFDTASGLVIDTEGIIDNSSGLSAGRIPWSDIERFHVTTVQGQRFLTVDVQHPQEYVERANSLKRLAISLNARYFGGPPTSSAGSAGEANNRSRREGVRGQTRRVLPRRPSCLRHRCFRPMTCEGRAEALRYRYHRPAVALAGVVICQSANSIVPGHHRGRRELADWRPSPARRGRPFAPRCRES